MTSPLFSVFRVDPLCFNVTIRPLIPLLFAKLLSWPDYCYCCYTCCWSNLLGDSCMQMRRIWDCMTIWGTGPTQTKTKRYSRVRRRVKYPLTNFIKLLQTLTISKTKWVLKESTATWWKHTGWINGATERFFELWKN